MAQAVTEALARGAFPDWEDYDDVGEEHIFVECLCEVEVLIDARMDERGFPVSGAS